MATPRVFVSSTYYDLRHVRNDIEVFLNSLGYTPVMHDRGSVTYTQSESLESSCYEELSSCDIVVCIVGSKFGTESENGPNSITMEEIRRALKAQKKVYIFLQKEVAIENKTYLANKDVDGFVPVAVEDIRIHQFIDELKTTVTRHPIEQFESVTDITENLKKQFAGLFQNLLTKESTLTEGKTYYDLKEAAESIRSAVNSFEDQANSFYGKFDQTIYAPNMLLKSICQHLSLSHVQIFVQKRDDLFDFIKSVGFDEDDESLFENDFWTFFRVRNNTKQKLTIMAHAFDDNTNIKVIRSSKQVLDLVKYEETEVSDEDLLPF